MITKKSLNAFHTEFERAMEFHKALVALVNAQRGLRKANPGLKSFHLEAADSHAEEALTSARRGTYHVRQRLEARLFPLVDEAGLSRAPLRLSGMGGYYLYDRYGHTFCAVMAYSYSHAAVLVYQRLCRMMFDVKDPDAENANQAAAMLLSWVAGGMLTGCVHRCSGGGRPKVLWIRGVTGRYAKKEGGFFDEAPITEEAESAPV